MTVVTETSLRSGGHDHRKWCFSALNPSCGQRVCTPCKGSLSVTLIAHNQLGLCCQAVLCVPTTPGRVQNVHQSNNGLYGRYWCDKYSSKLWTILHVSLPCHPAYRVQHITHLHPLPFCQSLVILCLVLRSSSPAYQRLWCPTFLTLLYNGIAKILYLNYSANCRLLAISPTMYSASSPLPTSLQHGSFVLVAQVNSVRPRLVADRCKTISPLCLGQATSSRCLETPFGRELIWSEGLRRCWCVGDTSKHHRRCG